MRIKQSPEYEQRRARILAFDTEGEEEAQEEEVTAPSTAPQTPLSVQRRKPQLYVALSNDIEAIEGPTALTWNPCSLNAMRIVLCLLFRVHAKRDKAFYTWETTCYDLSRKLGLDYNLNHTQTKRLLMEVKGLVFGLQLNTLFSAETIVETAELDTATGDVRLRLNPKLRPCLLNLARFRKLYPSVLKLQTPAAIHLYQHLRRFIGLRNPRHAVPMKDLQRAMQSSAPWKDFRRKHLDPAIKDINKHTELTVTYEVRRREGRKRGEIEFLVFTLSERKQLSFKGGAV